MFRSTLALLLACLMAACGQPNEGKDDRSENTNPLLWEIAKADGAQAGKVEGWLLGTIHALPDDTRWRGEAIDRVVAVADTLAVEIDGLNDSGEMAHAFAPLAFSPGQPPLLARVRPEQRDTLAAMVDETSYGLDDFGRIESWGAALILAQAVRSGADPRNGVDRALIKDFRGREIVELEGAAAQFAVFDGLSEQAQRSMLSSMVDEAQAGEAERQRPITLYLAGDVEGLESLTREGLLGEPEIRSALLTGRNADWMVGIRRLLAREQRPLIAVGAAHMLGEDGLVALLEAEGYRVTRVR